MTRSSGRPRIGITCDFDTYADKRGGTFGRYQLGELYVNAVVEAGGEPWLLAHLGEDSAPSVLEVVDGLVISGGAADVPPAFYGEEVRSGMGPMREQRSRFERALALLALERDLPLLGVCGGMQLLNVAAGGSLFQDLRERQGTGEHQQAHNKTEPQHAVEVAPGSLLARLTESTHLEVNSTHHQMVRRVGAALRPCAAAPDGVVEGIEAPARHFILGVQWHPESMAARGEQRAIYRGLIEAARGEVTRRP
jgi:putative glutamine amidotransferase